MTAHGRRSGAVQDEALARREPRTERPASATRTGCPSIVKLAPSGWLISSGFEVGRTARRGRRGTRRAPAGSGRSRCPRSEHLAPVQVDQPDDPSIGRAYGLRPRRPESTQAHGRDAGRDTRGRPSAPAGIGSTRPASGRRIPRRASAARKPGCASTAARLLVLLEAPSPAARHRAPAAPRRCRLPTIDHGFERTLHRRVERNDLDPTSRILSRPRLKLPLPRLEQRHRHETDQARPADAEDLDRTPHLLRRQRIKRMNLHANGRRHRSILTTPAHPSTPADRAPAPHRARPTLSGQRHGATSAPERRADSGEPDVDRLRCAVLVQRLGAELAAEAARLDAAHRRARAAYRTTCSPRRRRRRAAARSGGPGRGRSSRRRPRGRTRSRSRARPRRPRPASARRRRRGRRPLRA